VHLSKPPLKEDTFTAWRRSYRHLRELEGDLVSRSRSGEDPAVIATLYEKIEALRSRTSDLFQLAQTAGMAYQIPLARLTALPWEVTPSEFGALQGG
jgi:hypothetical protein